MYVCMQRQQNRPCGHFRGARARRHFQLSFVRDSTHTRGASEKRETLTKRLHTMESLSRQPDLDHLLYQSAVSKPAGAGHAHATAATLTPEKADASMASGEREEVQIKLVDKVQAVASPVEAAAIGGGASGAVENLVDATSRQLEEAGAGALDIAQRRALLLGRTKQRHVCLQCGRECPSKHKLKRHLSTHSEQRPYNCHLCGKSFKWTEYLAKHMRTQHPGVEGERNLSHTLSTLFSMATVFGSVWVAT